MTRTGRGHCHGAVTILNATATGHGCALAVDGGVDATWTWRDDDLFEWQTASVDDVLARSVRERVADACNGGTRSRGATARTTTDTPPARGLKTSSAAAGALTTAALDACGKEADWRTVCAVAVAASRDAGVTLTGAYDDQVAVVRGGCHLTDNRAERILLDVPTPSWHVAVWVPDASIAKSVAARVDATPAAAAIAHAESLLRRGDVAGAMSANGAAFERLYRAAGLPTEPRASAAARAAGALGAGLSGTGPAVAALFEDVVDLPRVPGGSWRWTRVQGRATQRDAGWDV